MAEAVFEKVTKIFPPGPREAREGVKAVNDVSLTMRDRAFTVIVGPSGCGKSTLLRLIAGLEEPTAGRILIGERDVSGVPAKDRDVAMVFQNYALYPHMNVYRNLSFALRMRRVATGEIDRRVREAAELLGLAELLERKPAQLSGGQRQRVAVGRAIVRDPAIFLFDEPLSNLDAKLRAETRIELKRLHRRLAATVIHVTHDQVEAMTLADEVVVMQGGVVQQVGAPLEVYEKPANRFVAGFLGSPPMNFLAGRLEEADGSLAFVGGELRVPLPKETAERLAGKAGAPCELGVRPERVRLAREGGGVKVGATVEVLEPLGSEQLVYLALGGGGGEKLTARMDSGERLAVGAKVDLELRPEEVHLFDAASGKSLTAGD